MPNTVKWHQYFAAQSAYLQHNPRRGAACHVSSSHEPSIILHGVKSSKLTIGRGHGSGVQVGRRNPRMSRQHFVIEHKPHMGYTLTVQSPNGVLVDRIMFMAGEHIPLVKGSMIEVLGTKLIFAGETEKQDYVETTLDPVVCSKPKPTPLDAPTSDVLDTLIRLLANSRKTSMTIPEIEQQLKQDRKALMELIQTTACIGCIERTGNTADGSPKEHLYYYKPELDANDERRSALSQSRRGARKCALKDTQYYFRIPPKLPNHRTKHSVDHKRKLNGQQQEHQTKKKRRSKTISSSSSSSSSSSHITTTTTLVTSPTTIPATTSPFSLSDDDELSDDGFLTSGDEYDDKELTALFQDV